MTTDSPRHTAALRTLGHNDAYIEKDHDVSKRRTTHTTGPNLEANPEGNRAYRRNVLGMTRRHADVRLAVEFANRADPADRWELVPVKRAIKRTSAGRTRNA